MLPRNLINRINRSLERFPVVVLIGSRQCGKTTLARTVRPEWRYFDLEKGSDYDFITRDYDFFFRTHPQKVILDEAQASPALFRELRGVVDANRMRRGRFMLTGSSSPELCRGISESLAGRVAILEVGTLKMNERYSMPLSPLYAAIETKLPERHLEYLKRVPVAVDTDKALDHFLKGGYPEPTVIGEDGFHAEWMAQYQQAYLQRDVRALYPGLNTANYRRFITMLAELSGTIINRSEIGRTLSVSESAVRDYLDIAQGTFIWRSIPSLERTVSKSVVKMPRGYIRDSGLLHHLARTLSRDQLLTRPGTGSAFEGFVIEELIRGMQAVENSPWSYHFFRTRGGVEVDLVMTSPRGFRIPVEIKFGSTVRGEDIRSLSTFVTQENCPYGVLINTSDEVKMLSDTIIQIPVGCL